MRHYAKASHVFQQIGDQDGLQASLASQAGILKARGDLDGAMKLHKEQERICRELGNPAGLARALANQAIILADKMNRRREAIPLLEEAKTAARQSGDIALLQWVQSLRI